MENQKIVIKNVEDSLKDFQKKTVEYLYKKMYVGDRIGCWLRMK